MEAPVHSTWADVTAIRDTSMTTHMTTNVTENGEAFVDYIVELYNLYYYPVVSSTAIGSLGILANGFVLVVLLVYSTNRRIPSTVLIIHQTLTDLLCSITIILTYLTFWFLNGRLEGAWGEFLCGAVVNETLFWICFNASSCNLVVITLERYMIVKHPVWHRNRFNGKLVLMLIIIIWVFSFFYSSSFFIVSSLESGWCTYDFGKYELGLVIFYFFGAFLAPSLFMTWAYGSMIYSMHKKRRSVHDTDSLRRKDKKLSKSQANTTKTMILVAIVYLVCLGPYQIYYLLYVGYIGATTSSIPAYLVLQQISLLNCCINPFIYAAKFDVFRSGIKRMFAGMKRTGGSIESRDSFSSETRRFSIKH